jgi:hypothetical protein
MEITYQKALEAIRALLVQGIEYAMNNFNET